ncbi:hypothetical protein RvY_05569 [Ramazzottius varieornatus]|uniref:Ig-like domain-containing protein n=1 Tax=Ramazzottius varieornatus TaxID=947166 RepID=A0A1D1V264_RAMVA|nr:hypothetical protein RvY_05569 [Ramazzottius varieornatus]
MVQLSSSLLSVVSLVAFLVAVSHGAVKITVINNPVGGETYFRPGGNITLICTTDQAGNLTWKVYDENPELTTRNVTSNDTIGLRLRDSKGQSEIVFSSLSGDVGGNYTCTHADGTSQASYYMSVLDSKALVPDQKVDDGTSWKVVLSCRQRLQPKLPLIWLRNVSGEEKTLNYWPVEDKNYSVSTDESSGYALTIQNARRYPSKTGAFTCRINTTGLAGFEKQTNLQAEATYQTTPTVRLGTEFPPSSAKSKGVTEGQPLSLTCVVSGADENPILWSRVSEKGKEVLVENRTTVLAENGTVVLFLDGTTVLLENGTKVIYENDTNSRWYITRDEAYEDENESREQQERTSILTFNSVADEDRGFYDCKASNQHGANNRTIEVKVKDKLAALWPFLGILGLVVILSAITWFHERRRKPRVNEEEDEPMKGGDVVPKTHVVTVKSPK